VQDKILRSADLQSAVSPICNRQGYEDSKAMHVSAPPAEYNSAIRQIANLRYEGYFGRVE